MRRRPTKGELALSDRSPRLTFTVEELERKAVEWGKRRAEPGDHSWLACRDIIGGPDSGRHPDRGYVIDLGLVDGQWKIVELNNLNSAGLYKSDTAAIVRALCTLR